MHEKLDVAAIADTLRAHRKDILKARRERQPEFHRYALVDWDGGNFEMSSYMTAGEMNAAVYRGECFGLRVDGGAPFATYEDIDWLIDNAVDDLYHRLSLYAGAGV
jgi:hypothetical protein